MTDEPYISTTGSDFNPVVKKHDFAESMNQSANAANHEKQNNEFKRAPMPESLRNKIRKLND